MAIPWHMRTWDDALRIVATTLLTPPYLLYIVLLIRYRHKKPFNSAFFRLNLAVGIFDVLAAWHVNLLVVLPYWGILSEEFWEPFITSPATTYIALSGTVFYTSFQWFMAAVLAINRCTAVFKPLKQKCVSVSMRLNRI